jgi:hypothetical protein
MFGLCFGLGRQFGISSNGEIRFIKINIYKLLRGFGTRNKYNFLFLTRRRGLLGIGINRKGMVVLISARDEPAERWCVANDAVRHADAKQ